VKKQNVFEEVVGSCYCSPKTEPVPYRASGRNQGSSIDVEIEENQLYDETAQVEKPHF